MWVCSLDVCVDNFLAVEELVDAGLNEGVIGSEFLGAAGIVAVVAVDYFKGFLVDAVHVCFRH